MKSLFSIFLSRLVMKLKRCTEQFPTDVRSRLLTKTSLHAKSAAHERAMRNFISDERR
jgi:hypothetical protein